MLTERTTTLFVSIFYFQKCQTRDYTAGNGGCQERKEAVLKRQPLFEFVGVARERPAKYLYDVSSNLNRKPHIC